ncbi:hypothetical protein EPUS_05382 [Endocarpon pusillum Z07020]|uniref:Kri1-like C-terminal domain-containing protein n=1 Tax=Endocarpon pusillum (strain Z07020 / HMAS-L-300199) TaxID=1263415 RepID=U1HX11_ENDPU|nr:uncharacterized protein EPUS_05382 [Endocarpon pusillum Z07020]ERF73959.1 hypothetical protein EPUS_05382 [Endocarpon pusillum Z07020]
MVKDFLNSDGSDSEDGGVQLQNSTEFKVNEEYARKFTHNKKREELRRLEDKLTNKQLKRKRPDEDDGSAVSSNEDSTSDSEEEDDAGELATEALDSEILATLSAIRSKDPRVYDKNTTFYTQIEEKSSEQGDQTEAKKEKPMFLRDYHRNNLLNDAKDQSTEIRHTTLSYNQEQEALKRSIVGEIHAATAEDSADSSEDDMKVDHADDGFLVKKPRNMEKAEQPLLDVEDAEKDPDTFLSNFMAARAWVPTERAQFQPFESDDDEEDRRAEEFEEAYNFRFEDPAKSNEKLVSHARDIAARYSVRREEKNSRKKQREAEGEKKEAAKRERAQEKARLRKLKIDEAEEKLRKIKKAAGLKGGAGLSSEDWARFMDDDWNDAKWEEEMQKRFGEAYYAQEDVGSDESPHIPRKRGRKPKKPKWEDDIEINDLVPDFEDGNPTFELSDEAPEEDLEQPNGINGINSRSESTAEQYSNRQDKKKEARKERRIIEQLVDDRLELDTALAGQQKDAAGFRYRETSPVSFGLSARDILMADDSQLNEYAGLKKLAAFRDPSKKRRDQKRLGKKARLRQWRRDTFGNEEGPILSTTSATNGDDKTMDTKERHVDVDGDIRTGATKKKRRRSKKNKGAQGVEV